MRMPSICTFWPVLFVEAASYLALMCAFCLSSLLRSLWCHSDTRDRAGRLVTRWLLFSLFSLPISSLFSVFCFLFLFPFSYCGSRFLLSPYPTGLKPFPRFGRWMFQHSKKYVLFLSSFFSSRFFLFSVSCILSIQYHLLLVRLARFHSAAARQRPN